MTIRRSSPTSTRNLERGFIKRLRKAQQNHKRSLLLENLEGRNLMATGPVLLGVQPNEGEVLANGQIRNVAPEHITFRFNEGQVIDSATLLNGIKLTRAGLDGVFGNANDVVITPGAIVVTDTPNEVSMRFSEPLVDDLYRIDVIGAGANPLRNTNGDAYNGGVNTSLSFELDLGALVTAIVPQPIVRTAGGQLQWGATERSQIEVYFNSDELDQASAQNPAFYQLYFTGDSATNTDDVRYLPTSAVYTAAQNKVLLTFAAPLDQLGSGAGTFRLRIGNNESKPLAPTQTNVTSDPGSSYGGALNIGTLGNQSQILSSVIDPQAYALQFPGGSQMPGNRDVYTYLGNQGIQEGNDQGINPAIDSLTPDTTSGPSVIRYNFKTTLGFQNPSTPYLNEITDAEKQRTREIFEIFSRVAGIQFIETADEGITVATGDLRVGRDDILTGAGGVKGEYFRLADGTQLVIMDKGETDWDDSYGGNWFREAMKEIGRAVGLEYTYDMPFGTIMGSNPNGLTTNSPVEPVFPGDQDIVNLQRLYRPDSIDIDLYKFNVTQGGTFTAETIAERLNSSLLNTNLNLYKEDGAGRRVLISRNDDYFSKDSYIELRLEPGTYYIGVSASGNNQYDPTISNTGIGGKSAGAYDLKINFKPDLAQADQLIDKDNKGNPNLNGALDGDADGVAGGAYNFWFRAQTVANTIIVDKANTQSGPGAGTIANPYKNINTALGVATSGKIVRIVGNGGADNNLATIGNNRPYEIGFNTFGQALPDGDSLTVPKGVTVMVDAGAILKFRRAAVVVGSTSATVDKSGAAFQVLGKPGTPVYMTSWGDEQTGLDTDPLPSTPAQGDWGGILYRNDIDNAAGRFNYENAGVFLNYVNNVNFRYGGGSVVIGSVPQSISPVQMVDARPEVSWNNIQFTAISALTANPNSFEETNFNAPKYQTTPFTSDYDRVGPDVHRNTLINNTLNGLLVRVVVSPNGSFDGLTTSARFDDADIVHIVQNTLQIRGTAGGPTEDAAKNLTARLDARLAIDKNIVVKLDGARIEALMGGQLIAESTPGNEVIFTSILDSTYGAGGTFETSKSPSNIPAQAGDWAGIYIGPFASASIDNAVFQYGGGVSTVEGTFTAFNVFEIHQSTVRLTDSLFRNNADGTGGAAGPERFGRGFNGDAAIYVRGSQPVIMANTFRNNGGPVISVNANSLNGFLNADVGRSTGAVELNPLYGDNKGPLVRLNRLADNGLNGMEVRGGVLTTESVWDDTDIVHVLREEIVVPDFHNYGGLTLRSNPTESLVVKSEGATAGITANGTELDIADRIGGRLSVIGLPGYSVIMTSLSDDTVGAGFMPNGQPQVDTNGDSKGGQGLLPTIGEVDRGLLIDNDVAPGVPGQFAFKVDVGGSSGYSVGPTGAGGGITAQGKNSLFVNEDVIFDFLNYIDIGPNGGAFELRGTTITQQPTLVSPDHIVSKGTFAGPNGTVRWQVDSYLNNGEARVYNELTLNADADFGDISFINYLDEDVGLPDNDILYVKGTPGEDDFRAYTLDNDERVGFAQGGILKPSSGLINATFTGWAADEFSNQRNQIPGAGIQYSVPGVINTINLPQFNDPELGTVYGQGDVTTAFRWTVSPTARNAKITSFLDLIATNPGKQAGPGDWRGIKVGEFANDRNVIIVQESEASTSIAPGNNAIPDRAQLVGNLAPNEKSGDENRRLGFEVQGYLSQINDVDVFSFKADAGTQVWLDMDRTTQSLDAIIELVDVNGIVIARSNNSEAEGDQLESLFKYDRSIQVKGLQKSANFVDDLYTLNPRDPGMAVVLPGPAGTNNTYYVRVRSTPADGALNDSPVGGLTSGAYQFQIRLSEVDEVPGTTVRYSDIRFATNGIQVLGQPTHSPLLGETAEVETGNTRANAQLVGNLGTADRGSIAISGIIDNGNDVDWFSFDVNYEGIENIPGHTDLTPEHYATTIDLDYADGLGRGNFSVYVFNSNGELVYMGQDSNIASDRPAPATSLTQYDANRGSFGTKDASIGPVELPEGRYFVAIASSQQIPAVLQQNFVKNLAEEQKIIRREPINSTQRISEDHLTLDPFGNRVPETTTAGFSQTPILFDRVTDTLRGTYDSIVPYTLGDLTMFATSRGAGGQTNLNTIDAFTGNIKTVMSGNGGGFDYEDMTLDAAGRILAFNNRIVEGLLPTNDDNSSIFLIIDPVTGAQTAVDGTSGIQTFNLDAGNSVRSFGLSTGAQDGVGIHTNAISTYYSSSLGEIGLIIGNRGDVNFPPPGVTTPRNIMYRFDLNTGNVINWNFAPDKVAPANGIGVGTQSVEANVFTTARNMVNNTENITGMAYVGAFQNNGPAPGNMANDGPLFMVTDQGRLYRLNSPSGNVIQINGGQPYRDPVTNNVLNFTNVAKPPNGVEYNGAGGATGLDRVVIATTSNNRMYAINVDTGALTRVFFDGRTFVTINAQSFAPAGKQNTDGTPFGAGGVTNGIVFTALARNPWGFGNERRPTPDQGPGIPDSHDEATSFERQTNNISFRFDGPTPGDKGGTLMSLPFSLEGYSSSDKPYMYMDYSLFSSDVNHDGGSGFVRDGVRVYIGTPDGDWKLAATNNDYRNWNQFAPYTQNDEFDINQRVQGLMDRNNTIASGSDQNNFNWRQVRVSLDDFAGMKDLRIRVEAARSGTSYVNDSRYTGYELKVKAGRDLRDGEQIVIQNGLVLDTFEIDLGTTLVIPSGGVIPDGEILTLSNGIETRTYEFDRNGSVGGGNIALAVTPNMEAEDVARVLFNAISADATANAAFVPFLNGNRLNLRGDAASGFNVTPTIAGASLIKRDGVAGVSGTNRIVRIDAGMEAVTPATVAFGPTSSVREVFRQALADAYTINLADSTRQTSDLQAFRAFNDFVRLTMKEVVSAGPFGVNKGAFLEGAEYGENNNNYTNPNTQTSAFGGHDNNYEGMYIDDIYIGFAERGERITQSLPATQGGDVFVANNLTQSNQRLNWDETNVQFPTQLVNQVTSGPYRVEIRQGSNYGEPLEYLYSPTRLALTRMFDTNEVHGAETTLVMPNGSVIPEGATIRVGDGLNAVTLEFDDLTMDDGVRAGNIKIPYSPSAPASVIAAQIRDVLNSNAVRSKINVAAGLSDGVDGTGVATFTPTEGTQSPNNDVYNPLTFPSAPNAVDARTLGDFTTSNANIGDNPSKIGANRDRDVDLYVFNGRAGIPVQFRVDASIIGSALNPLIRIFDPATGTQLAFDDNSGPGNDALLNFTPQLTQTYIVGVSASGNSGYTIGNVNSSSAGGSTGNYRLTSLGLGSSSNMVNLFGSNLLITGVLNEQGLPLDDASVRIDSRAFLDQTGVTNDTIDDPAGFVPSTAVVVNLPSFSGTGRIGDNSAVLPGRDVDIFKFSAKSGQKISIEVTGEHNQSLQPVVRLFDATGAEIAIATPNPAFGTSERTLLDVSIPADGNYFIGVSGAGYSNYLSTIANSGTPALLEGQTGIYSIKVWDAAAPASVGAVSIDALGDAKGDTNDDRQTSIDTTSNIHYVATAVIGDNLNSPVDVDVYKFGARFGDVFKIRVDATPGSLLTPSLRVLDAAGNPVAGATLVADAIGGFNFTPSTSGLFYIEVGGASSTTGAYRLEYRNLNVPNVIRTIRYNQVDDTAKVLDFFDPNVSTYLFERRDMKGDSNLKRDQGQIVIEANRISKSSEFGLDFDAGARSAGSLNPHQASVSVLRELNANRTAPGVVAVNNVVFGNLQGAIQVSGIPNLAGEPQGSLPFARIVNNTLYGVGGTLSPSGTNDDGILVSENASPTLLNNIIANFARGLNVSADSQTTVQGGSLYAGNGTNSNYGLGASSIVLTPGEPLFVNAGKGNFYLESGSKAIDSSVDSLADRADLVTIRNPLGIPLSPILAPDLDATGQARVPASPTANVFRDRGAIDRSDFSGPTATVINPLDNDAAGVDVDARQSVVRVPANTVLTNFIIGLFDSQDLNDPVLGTGVDNDTVDASKVQVFRDGQLLVAGTHYSFSFDTTNKQIRLTPLEGVWPQNSAYVIKLDNSAATGIKDLAENPLQANRLTGETIFEIFIGNGYDYGDAPDPSYPTLITSGGARHVYYPDIRLGNSVNPKANGLQSPGANADVDDDGVTFDRTLLPGGVGIVTVTPSVNGKLSAWIDWNQDGDWNDPGERVINNKSVVAGSNTVNFDSNIPTGALLGNTFARFRFSTDTISGPAGDAIDGEVEDYQVSVTKSSWQNQNGGKYGNLNVSDDYLPNGNPKISAFDVLLVIAEINLNGARLLPDPPTPGFAPPPFYDVNGDGGISSEDARLILEFLDAPPSDAGGESGSGTRSFFVSAGNSGGEGSGTALTAGASSGNGESTVGGSTAMSTATETNPVAYVGTSSSSSGVVSSLRAAATPVRRSEVDTSAAVASNASGFSGQSSADFDRLLSVIASGSKKKSSAEAADAIFGDMA